jgi:Asp-tRNA(Asn)/Glu-tRNA(Gln) amidotransferase A subunit family amidase
LLAERAVQTGAAAKADELEPMTWAALARLRHAGEAGLAEALRLRDAVAQAHLGLFETCDILLTPTLAIDPAPVGTLGFNDLGSLECWAQAGYGFAPFSILANIAGQPAASLPLPRRSPAATFPSAFRSWRSRDVIGSSSSCRGRSRRSSIGGMPTNVSGAP